MPVTPTYPGVYVEEIPSGVRTIVGVATSVTAFLGRARKGPVNQPVTINSYADFEREFGGLWKESGMGYAVRDFYLNGGAKALVVRLFKSAPAAPSDGDPGEGGTPTPAPDNDDDDSSASATESDADSGGSNEDDVPPGDADGAGGGDAPEDGAAPSTAADEASSETARIELKDENDAIVATLAATSPGTWANEIYVRIDHDVIGDESDAHFNIAIRDTHSGVEERYLQVTLKSDARGDLKTVLAQNSRLLQVTSIANANQRPAKHPAPAPNEDPWDDDHATKISANGNDGAPLETASYTGNRSEKKGIYALEHADLFNLLCIPPSSPDGETAKEVFELAEAYCQERRALLLVDAPKAWNTVAKARDGLGSFITNRKNAALFFPALRQPNPEQGARMERFVPCGAVAGVMARTDQERGVWKAPAGYEAILKNVPELSLPMTDTENGELNPLGINCLRSMPPAGRVVWGARTLQGDDRLASDWKYIPVRRLALYIEESLYRGTHWVVFEPNDEPLWSQIRLSVGSFMHNLFRQGAFQGASPKEAYFVRCDRTTTTQYDIDRGIVNIEVGFAPLKPAEFVIIKLQQISALAQV